MKYTLYDYARAILDLSETLTGEEKKNLPKQLAATLEKNGSLGLYPQIAEAVKELDRAKSGKKQIVVKYAGHVEKTKIREEFGDGADVEFIESPEIKGGVQIFIGDLRIDNSLSGRLTELKKVLV